MLEYISPEFTPIIEGISKKDYVSIDLSVDNTALENISIFNNKDCKAYIDKVLHRNNAKVAFGGYLERRSLYSNNSKFTSTGSNNRNIHLGMDFWSDAGTNVLTPLDGVVHSFKNNSAYGDYGPTIILEHKIEQVGFFSLYGHLSLESIADQYIGKQFKKGSILGSLGVPEINVGYAPHLHFQIVMDLQGCFGDYPGVCSAKDKDFYAENCPDPNYLLGL